MNIQEITLQFEDKQLLLQIMQLYYQNNDIKILASNNYKFTALSLARMTGYSTRNESGYNKQPIEKGGFASFYDTNNSYKPNIISVLTPHICFVI